MSRISVGQSIALAKCPQCREGRIFLVSMFSYRKLTQVNKICPVCEANFVPEPDFFYGAMYISYAFSVALVITALTAINVLVAKPELWMSKIGENGLEFELIVLVDLKEGFFLNSLKSKK
jgi:uncharacterized protein (DUF983 family)